MKSSTKFLMKALDVFLIRGLLIDFTSGLIFFLLIFGRVIFKSFSDDIAIDDVRSLYSDLSTASLALAGFVITALTIILSIKYNNDAFHVEKQSEALSAILSNDGLFRQIIKVFFNAAIILFFAFILLTVVKVFCSGKNHQLTVAIFFGTFLMVVLSLFRSLYVLGSIVRLQHGTDDN